MGFNSAFKGLSYTVRYTSVSAAYRRAIPLGPQ